MRGPSVGRHRLLVFVAVAPGILLAAAYLRHVFGYFFLFDDFALLSSAREFGVAGIATSPLFGFFRPLPFVLVRAMVRTLGPNAAAFAAAGPPPSVH